MKPDKRTHMRAAAELLRPGDTLALGGLTIYRRPMAFVHALLHRRDSLRDLTLLCYTASIESDLLIGAGMVKAIRSCYVGLEIFGFAPMFTRKVGAAEVRMIEESEASLAFGIKAVLAGLSFMPGLGWLGADMLALRPDVKLIEDPYNPGRQLVAYPATPWDVAVIHALKADPQGNAVINGNRAVDPQLAFAGRDVIITAEEIVERFDERVDIVGERVSAVVHAPRGAWPTSCYPLYPIAGGELLRYIEMCNAGEFEAYLASLEERMQTG